MSFTSAIVSDRPTPSSHRPVLAVFLVALALALSPSPSTARGGGPLFISEIHCEPAESSPAEGEWIELWNHSDTVIDLEGWSLRDRDFDEHTIRGDGPLLVQPDSFVVLARDAEALSYFGVEVLYEYGDAFILDDEEDEVILVDPTGTVVDEVHYDRRRGWPNHRGRAMAWSLRGDNALLSEWRNARFEYASGDHGSPGHRNGEHIRPEGNESPGSRTRELYASLLLGSLTESGAAPYEPVGEEPANYARVLTLGFCGSISDRVALRLEIPFVKAQLAELEFDPGTQSLYWSKLSKTTMGNPYLGLVIDQLESTSQVELGVHLPLLPSPSGDEEKGLAAIAGSLVDYAENAEAFALEALPLSLRFLNPDLIPGRGVIGIDFGTHVWLATGEREEAEFFMNYRLEAAYEGAHLRPGAELVGRLILRGNGGLEDKLVNEARGYVEARLGIFVPRVELRLPLSKNLDELVDTAVALRVGLDLP